MTIDSARRVATQCVSLAVLATLVGCTGLREDLLAAEDPDIISPESVKSAAGADALRVGAYARLRDVTAGGGGSNGSAWTQAGLLVDEWKSSNTFSQHNETDERKVQDNNSVVLAALRDLYRVRTSAREAIDGLREFKADPPAGIGQMYFAMAYAEMTIAEMFCNGTPLGDASTGVVEYGPPLTNAQLFTLALAHADSALALASGTTAFATEVRNSSSVLKGRILLNLNRHSDVAAAVAAVPTTFSLLGTFSLTSGSNAIWNINTSAKRFTVGDNKDPSGTIINALPFASAGDPRMPVVGTSTGTSPAGRGFDNSTNFIRQLHHERTSSAPLVSGLDARLFEAEVALKAGDIPGMMTILNALRATPQVLTSTLTTPVMPALTTPGTADEAINLYFYEKGFWTFSRGMRLPDLRRLVRQYGRSNAASFPTGTFFKTNQPYGPDMNFPVMREELTNPNFTACTDRNA